MSSSLLQCSRAFRKRKIVESFIRKDTRSNQPPVKRFRHFYATTLSFDRFMDVDPVRIEFTRFREGNKKNQNTNTFEDSVSLESPDFPYRRGEGVPALEMDTLAAFMNTSMSRNPIPVQGVSISTPPKRVSCRSCENRKTASVGHLRFVLGNLHRTFAFTVLPFEDPALCERVLISRLFNALSSRIFELTEKFRLTHAFQLEMSFFTGRIGKRTTVSTTSTGTSGVWRCIANFTKQCPNWRDVFKGGAVAVFATVQRSLRAAPCTVDLLSASSSRFKVRLARTFLLRSEVEQNGVGHFVPLSYAYKTTFDGERPVIYKAQDGEVFWFEHPFKLVSLTESYSSMKSLMPTANAAFAQ